MVFEGVVFEGVVVDNDIAFDNDIAYLIKHHILDDYQTPHPRTPHP